MKSLKQHINEGIKQPKDVGMPSDNTAELIEDSVKANTKELVKDFKKESDVE